MSCRVVIAAVFLMGLGLAAAASATDRVQLRWIRNKPVIDSIVVEGNEYFSAGEIKKRMYSRKRNVWGWLKGDRRTRIQRETLRRDTLEIKYMYLTKGFLGIQIQESFEITGIDSAALIRVQVDEGRQFRYGRRQVTGSFERRFGYSLNKIALNLKEGEPVNLFEVREAVFDMKTILANGGFPYARVTHLVDTSGADGAAITFEIDADSLVHFGDIAVKGTENFPEYTARRELRIRKGAVYRRDDILRSQRRLFESGYFSTFQINQADTLTDRLQPDFVLRVRERRPLYVSFETGAAQSQERDLEWSFSPAFGKRNLWGSRRLDLLADYSFSVGRDTRLLTHRYQVRFTEPWFLGIRMPLTLSGELNPRLKDPTQNFDKQSWVVAAATTKRFGIYIKANLGFEYQSVEISGVPEDQIPLIKSQEGISARRKLYFNIRRDSREDLFIPRSGSVTDFSAEFFGGFLGGDENFFRFQTGWSRYQIFWPGWIAASRVRVGWTEEFGASEFVPSDELLYIGGANSIRGFKENTLGPQLPDGSPKGARLTLIFNQEFRWKTLQIFSVIPVLDDLFRALPLWQSLFFDAGNGFDSRADFSLEDLAFSYGTGVQIASPAGPIRLDYARRIKTDKIDFASRWHFTILYAF
ncbi:MAG: BamA/TamA family outer membrane protein [candidate division Zixibacteria bacterium]|nr:BamA/TamA family outer membrane protein [candidate division Zixibacteria bacterium]